MTYPEQAVKKAKPATMNAAQARRVSAWFNFPAAWVTLSQVAEVTVEA